jgi:hypothetical protein
MFGTFAAERAEVPLVYGLVDQPQFWNPVKHQVGSSFLGVTIARRLKLVVRMRERSGRQKVESCSCGAGGRKRPFRRLL